MKYNNHNINKNEYSNIHQWIRSHYGSATKCENNNCEYNDPKRFEWALRKGKKYEKNINNFKQMCASCHRKYDLTNEIKKHIKEASYKAKLKFCPKGHLYSKENTRIMIIKKSPARCCRICIKKYQDGWKIRNKEYIKKYQEKWRQEHKLLLINLLENNGTK